MEDMRQERRNEWLGERPKEMAVIAACTLTSQLGLTHREGEVLYWLSEGKANSEIAILVGARPRTIGKHLEHVFAKLGVESRTAAAATALRAIADRP
jgi:DNA-binding CsgD family transcriptional regulator